jgi:hypothetical protein
MAISNHKLDVFHICENNKLQNIVIDLPSTVHADSWVTRLARLIAHLIVISANLKKGEPCGV